MMCANEQVRAVYEVLLPHLAGGNLAEAITVRPFVHCLHPVRAAERWTSRCRPLSPALALLRFVTLVVALQLPHVALSSSCLN